ncbi:DUF4333 domain-containing protein [Nonomuraea sp. NPDC049709]|uniref:DUF4333 domain-containing protein n=1 Tax=Nonomuraea sp. NPDC049709 TaxID=3154736 RepID=UPI0034266582
MAIALRGRRNHCQPVHVETAIFQAMRMGNMRIGFPASLACGVVLVAGCSFSFSAGSTSVERPTVEQQVADQLAAKVGQRPKAVVCPGDLKGEQGTTMRCQLEANDGTKLGLTVTVTSVKGSDVKFNIKVDNK